MPCRRKGIGDYDLGTGLDELFMHFAYRIGVG